MQLSLAGAKIGYCVFAVGEKGSMRSVTETFREWDFDDEFMARQCRDERLVELQAAGYDCVSRDLYALHNGQRVFVVDARSLVLEGEGADEDSFGRSESLRRGRGQRGRSVGAPRLR
jgi:hypothetical protein